jgi:hypothetical protein
MSKDQVTALAIIGAAGALIAALAISRVFLGYATETYALAIRRGSPSAVDAAAELKKMHLAEMKEGSLRGFLARSIASNGGVVYNKRGKCDFSIPCEGFGCRYIQCGEVMWYAHLFAHVTYRDGIVKLPPPGPDLWILTAIAGTIIGLGVGSEKRWGRLLAIGVIIGAPIFVVAVRLSPTIITVLLSAVIGGILALLARSVIFHVDLVEPQHGIPHIP